MQTFKKKEWYLKNRVRLIKEAGLWKKNNPDRVKKSAKKYYEKNKEAIFLRNKIYKRNHYIKHPRGFRNLVGMKFGRLRVISLNCVTKNRDRFWNCICDCGNQRKVSGISLIRGRSQSCGCLHKEITQKMCQQRVGSKNPGWTGENASYGVIHQWLRKNNKKEKCLHCQKTNKTLDFALIAGKKHSRNIKNYITLCRKCHVKYDNIYEKRKK